MTTKNYVNQTTKYLLKWILIAVSFGFLGSLLAAFMTKDIVTSSLLLKSYPILLPIVGGIFLIIIYRIDKEAIGYGTSRYLHSVNGDGEEVQGKEVITKTFATIITIGIGGSGGLTGPALMIGSSFASLFKKWFRQDEIRTLLITGAAALLGAIFNSPIGAGLLVVEITYRTSLHYKDAFPALLGSIFGYLFGHFLFDNRSFVEIPSTILPKGVILPTIITSIIAGLVALSFIIGFDYIRDKADQKVSINHRVIITIFGIIIFNQFLPEVTGLGKDVIVSFFTESYGLLFLLSLLFGKVVLTTLTSALGGSAGLVLPAIFIGGIVGSIIFTLFGMPDTHLIPLVIAGIGAMLAGIVNAPIAVTIILMEIAGTELTVIAAVASIIGYAISNTKTIYDKQF